MRYAADADHKLIVVEDGSADHDSLVDDLLMEKDLPRQASVATSRAVARVLNS